MISKWFTDYETVEEIKSRYRELAKEHHPDRGGDTATMQEINNEYEYRLENLHKSSYTDEHGKEHTYYYNAEHERAIMDMIADLLAQNFPDHIDIWLIGKWIWITGTNRDDIEVREALKSRGFKWHKRRAKWYWKPYEYRGGSHRGSLADIADKYGAKRFAQEERGRQQREGMGRPALGSGT